MPQLAATPAPFALVRLSRRGEPPVVGLRRDGRVREVTATELGRPADIRSIMENWDDSLEVLRTLAAASDGWIDESEVTLAAPVEPRQVIQAGANYRTHVIDLVLAQRKPDDTRSPEQARAETAAMMDERAAHGIPYFFIGLPTVIAAESDELVLPSFSQKHDWELELAVVIGRRAHKVSVEDALDYVAGYTIVNDVSTRDYIFRRDMPEIGTDWFRGKNSPGFLPTGPNFVPAEFVGDPRNLGIRLSLNGQVMQDSNTSDMIFDVARLISAASETLPLLPGDLLLTGSPEGNGIHHGRLLRHGDVMVGEVEGLGSQTIRCVAEEPSA